MVDQLTIERDSLQKDCTEMKEKMADYDKDFAVLKAELKSKEREVDGLRSIVQNGSGKLDTPPTKNRKKASHKKPSTPASTKDVAPTLVQEVATPTSPNTPNVVTSSVELESPFISTFFAGSEPPVANGNTPPADIWADDDELVLLLVFRYLSILELIQVGGVCQQWRQVSRHPTLWREVEFRDIMLTPEMLDKMATWCTQTELLKLHGLIPQPAEANEDLDMYVQRQRGCMESSLALFCQASGHCLRKVYITECHVMVTERVLWLLGIYCPNLQEVAYSSMEFPACAEAIWSLSCGAPDIRALYFPPVTDSEFTALFNDHCLYRIATGFPRLRCAAIGGPSITPKGVAQFIFDCPNLRDLRLVECFEINQSTVKTMLSVGSSKLVAVSFIHTQVTPRAISLLTGQCVLVPSIHGVGAGSLVAHGSGNQWG
jgi:hypothetical protein